MNNNQEDITTKEIENENNKDIENKGNIIENNKNVKEKSCNKKNRFIYVLRTILIIMIVSWMLTEFKFSAQVSEKSSHTSDVVTDYIIDHNKKTKTLPAEKKVSLREALTTIVRKSAHFSMYTLGGIILVSFTSTFKKLNRKQKMGFAWLYCIVYAMSDEFHQLFVPGRSGEIRDVCIDSSGALLGVLLMTGLILLVNLIIKKIQGKRVKNT